VLYFSTQCSLRYLFYKVGAFFLLSSFFPPKRKNFLSFSSLSLFSHLKKLQKKKKGTLKINPTTT